MATLELDRQQQVEENLDTANVNINYDSRAGLVKMLNTLLADEHLLYVKTRNFHWNVTGPHFLPLHELFERQYNELKQIGDDVAERARMLGGTALGSMKEFMAQSRLQEVSSTELPSDKSMLANLLDDHETLINYLRDDIAASTEKYQDESTADLLIEVLRMHEEMAWMIRSTLHDFSH